METQDYNIESTFAGSRLLLVSTVNCSVHRGAPVQCRITPGWCRNTHLQFRLYQRYHNTVVGPWAKLRTELISTNTEDPNMKGFMVKSDSKPRLYLLKIIFDALVLSFRKVFGRTGWDFGLQPFAQHFSISFLLS